MTAENETSEGESGAREVDPGGAGQSGAGRQDRITVLIVDDHQVVRQGLRTFLELHDDIDVVGEAGDGEAAVDMVRRL